jgi:hypothetical protein
MALRLRSVAPVGPSRVAIVPNVVFPGVLLGVLLGVHLGAALEAQPRVTKQDADRCQGKLGRITGFANTPRARASASPSSASQTTQLTDAELNSYLHFHLKDQVPAGVVDPTLSALGEGRVRGAAIIDLDAVRKQKQRGWTDPLSYMTGRLPLTASGLLITQNGVGRFQLESAEISGIAIPKSLLQELLAYYSKSADKPSGISMDDPFELPARIKEIRVGKGEAMVVQ